MSAAAAVDPARVLHVEHCMGTVFTIDIRDLGSWDEAVGDVVAWLHRVDAVFSTYQPGSDISRIRRRELSVREADPLVGEVLGLCAEMKTETDGYFSALYEGQVDPTGLVKGWAIERASALLTRHGSGNHAVNGGGDIQLAGEAGPDRPWRVGITDPLDRTRVLTVVSGRDLAVASSGVAERGVHILDPHTGAPATGLAGVTVVGPRLARVDAYATAAFAMGPRSVSWVDRVTGYEALVVPLDGTLLGTRGWAALVGALPPSGGHRPGGSA